MRSSKTQQQQQQQQQQLIRGRAASVSLYCVILIRFLPLLISASESRSSEISLPYVTW